VTASTNTSATQLVDRLTAVRTEHVSKTFHRPGTLLGATYAVRDVSISVPAQQTLGLVGESGSGKSTLARLIMQLLPATDGRVFLYDSCLTTLSGRGLRAARRHMQMVFQDPYSSLDPRMAVLDAVIEPLIVHGIGTRSSRGESAAHALEQVGLSAELGRRYPHEFSGGQRQRIALARALVLEPRVLILDEPLSALDVSIQAQILNLLMDLKDQGGLTYLFISHDIAAVNHLSNQIAVMYLGQIVEWGPARTVVNSPGHPYTRALLDAVPVAHPRFRQPTNGDQSARAEDLRLSGVGCPYQTRCPLVQDICREVPPRLEEGAVQGHTIACHFRNS
jgi:oligopeptide/dipeptide ABC transporter ATP-binding protein